MAGYVKTSFGNIPLPDDNIPRAEWLGYVRAAKHHAQMLWMNGLPPSPLSLDDARRMKQFERVKDVTSEGYIDYDTGKSWRDDV